MSVGVLLECEPQSRDMCVPGGRKGRSGERRSDPEGLAVVCCENAAWYSVTCRKEKGVQRRENEREDAGARVVQTRRGVKW
ncbi:hypothetical protein GLAREA_09049 [Glarea lozoyensis ATCC 20868]|uniref:Uncharacterized protein n=1 Tax=Glarea lozoyensis (strain ATCC 20868 / MF5171) TaxID=1116229 RepID=S3DY88_GLAL2|nr:uncharacterized protein GLAREA_09049 [Glarea lozoyensis ATCC 20868]EPE36886.1 hypothetical protein GLAREA_09049 [Glarea lozoyensis ATCC 20868]